MLRDTLFGALSSLLLILSFPTFNLSLFAWIALIPLLIILVERKPVRGFLFALFCGVIFFAGVFNWGLQVASYTVFHHFLLSLCFAIYLGAFGLLLSLLSRRYSPMLALYAAPFVWTSFEYIKSNLFFLAFPWGLLAHTQHQNLQIIQIAAITGAYGISFLIVLVNSALAGLVFIFLLKNKEHKSQVHPNPSRGAAMGLAVSALIITVAVCIYGQYALSRTVPGEPLRISLVQGNIPQEKKWKSDSGDFIMQTYTALTRKVAAMDQPQLIIWPETATPGFILKKMVYLNQLVSLIREIKTYMLIGSAEYSKYQRVESDKPKVGNTVLLFSPEGKVLGQYIKIRLLPFGEYTPMKGIIPWSWIKVPDLGGYLAGTEFTVFEGPSCRFGVTLCWENIFPGLVRGFVKNGAQFMVNMTNEAWFRQSSAPEQFVSMSVFRAVENRVYVVRCGNTGISCFIDPNGKIVSQLKDKMGHNLFVRGTLTGTVFPALSKTIYTKYGDWFAALCILSSLSLLVLALWRGGKRDSLRDEH